MSFEENRKIRVGCFGSKSLSCQDMSQMRRGRGGKGGRIEGKMVVTFPDKIFCPGLDKQLNVIMSLKYNIQK